MVVDAAVLDHLPHVPHLEHNLNDRCPNGRRRARLLQKRHRCAWGHARLPTASSARAASVWSASALSSAETELLALPRNTSTFAAARATFAAAAASTSALAVANSVAARLDALVAAAAAAAATLSRSSAAARSSSCRRLVLKVALF
jgi:hypothetical protein